MALAAVKVTGAHRVVHKEAPRGVTEEASCVPLSHQTGWDHPNNNNPNLKVNKVATAPTAPVAAAVAVQ